MIVLSSKCGLEDARSSFVAAVCKAALPSNHPLSFQSTSDKARTCKETETRLLWFPAHVVVYADERLS
ncbi:unnamed protein product [Dibothriocephalus latus]|uniref:Uncharacterized protein n=1 Tax=Dibothriocephalus latus TaxID=60516 RepID=A0A3P7LUM7_DIBLA|nr:unnamed protein product [Dibothriocephalus latus]